MSQQFKIRQKNDLDAFFWDGLNGFVTVTKTEAEKRLIEDIIGFRNKGYDSNTILINLKDLYYEFKDAPYTSKEVSDIIKQIQNDYSYPRLPEKRVIPKCENIICPICKDKVYDSCEVFTFWKHDEVRIASFVCLPCWDRLQDLFCRGWQDNNANQQNSTTQIVRRRRDIISAPLRHEIFKRDNYKCVECGATKHESKLHIDHITPISQGGSDEMDNLQTLCKECNMAKSNRKWETSK